MFALGKETAAQVVVDFRSADSKAEKPSYQHPSAKRFMFSPNLTLPFFLPHIEGYPGISRSGTYCTTFDSMFSKKTRMLSVVGLTAQVVSDFDVKVALVAEICAP